MSETNRIEYKREFSKKVDLEKEVIAFLNYPEGGEIYIGINADKTIYGVSNLDETMLKIKDSIKNNIQPSCLGLFDIIALEKEKKNVIKIIVSSGTEKPYYKRRKGMTPEGSFVRIGSASEPMTQKMIDELFAKRTRNSIGKIIAPVQDLNFEQLHIYYQEKKKPLNKQFQKNLELATTDNAFNYVAYLLADTNNMSFKVAKYKGIDRIHLSETNEYGYQSLIKACKSVLDKIDIENKTQTLITAKDRKDKRLWNTIALKEAIINAFVHNDYTREAPPKFEIFSDRIEITSTGSLPNGLSEEEFFEGFSIPRNKELIRIFKDLELVEQLGSGIPRIIAHYSEESFKFSDNFLRITLPKSFIDEKATEHVTEQVDPSSTPQVPLKLTPVTDLVTDPVTDPVTDLVTEAKKQVTEQVTEHVRNLIRVMDKDYSISELMRLFKLTHKPNFRNNYLNPALEGQFIELTIPDKPKSSKQKYRLTQKGKSIKK
ncbi:Fic family protein [uncultured Polaribacter sp.]|uniref:Fic family protein n=1 Tax=uncultured Polaribacter sp. TaxID=174711 RepID=UPI0026152463|nr:RNA-binding domain-containing protein [uncultured Polaribacter sp.]